MSVQLVDESFVPVINREVEIREATNRLEQMIADLPVVDCVLFFSGVSMVGKTTLLEAIRREASGRGIPSALIDFDREQVLNGHRIDNWYDGYRGQVHLVQHLMGELSRTGEFGSNPLMVSDNIDPREATEKLLDFARDLYYFGQRRPFLLLFDTIEDCDIETLLWAQNAILEPFVSEFHILILFASRTPPNTIRHELIYPLERRTVKYHLQPFDERETSLQIEKIGASDILPMSVTELRRYTGGLPGLNNAAARWLSKENSVEQLLNYLVEKIVFERLAYQINKLNVHLEVLAVSPLRQFDSGLLGRIVRTLLPDKYFEGGLRPIRELLNKLQETRLVEPHLDGYGYVIPHDLRYVLDAYWQRMQKLKHFQVHQIAVQWFAEQVADGDYVAVADYIYHLGGLQRDVNEQPQFREHLDLSLGFDPADPKILKMKLDNVLKALHKKSSRPFDLSSKIKRTLSQPEFLLVFESDLLNELTGICQTFNDEL